MSFTATANKSEGGGGGFEKAPAGTHPAVLVAIIDLGEQWVEPFGNAKPGDGQKQEVAKWKRQLYYVYELVTKKRTQGPGNHLIAIDLNFSMNEKAKMRKWVEARTGVKIKDGAEYDVTQELGQPVLLTVEMKGEYPRIGGVTGIPEGYTVPPPSVKPVAWVLDPAKLADIPPWVPYLYGRKIADVVRDSRQIKGERKTQPAQPNMHEADAPADGVPF